MSKVTQGLNKLLAENYALYLKTQSYHWNVIGPNFWSLHLLFEEQYKDLAEANDLIAERIRALDERVEVSFSIFNTAKLAGDPVSMRTNIEMLQELAKDHQYIAHLLLEVSNDAANNNDKATEDMMIQRLREHQKQIWILKSCV